MYWSVYMVRCADGSYYTGIAKDLDARIDVHNQGKGAKYTRSRLPVTLVYTELAPDRSTASQREHAIKQLSRESKEKLMLDIKRKL